MKLFRALLPSLLLAALPAAAQESVPLPAPGPPPERPPEPALQPGEFLDPLPTDPAAGPGDPAPPEFPGDAVNPALPGAVPGIRVNPGSRNVGRTWSDNSPFNLWGGTRIQRSSLFTAAGIVRREVLDALRQPDQWTHPVVIQLREPLAAGTDRRPPVWTTVSQVEGGFRIEVTLVPRRQSVPGPMLRENLARAVLADMVLRGQGKVDLSGAPTPPPDWLLHGTLALMDYRQLGRHSTTFSRVFKLGRVLSVQDIFNADPHGMDSVSLAIYRVSCGALLEMLLKQPQGSENFAKVLPALAQGGTDHAALIENAFPALAGTSNSLSKWWSLEVATLSQPGLEEVRAPAETERLLKEALVLHFTPPKAEDKKTGTLKRLFSRGKKPEKPVEPSGSANQSAEAGAKEQTCPLEDYAKVLPLPDAAKVFGRTELALTQLMLRAHPVYRPMIQEYQDLVRDLGRKKAPKNLPATLERLSVTRTRLAQTIQGIEDHLDWFEATQSQHPSGQFEEYLRAAEEVEQPPEPRNDPLSRYLDEVEAEYRK